MIKHANLFYFRRISRIGGTEQFLYEIAKKYHKKDIAVLYDDGDPEQIARLRKLVKCIKRNKEDQYVAERAFYNFNIEAIDQIEAKEHIFICHAVYQELQFEPPIGHPKLTKILAVSKYAESRIKLQEKVQNVDKPVIQCYNPLTLEKPDKVLRIISACRLEDETKGGKRTLELIKALDKYCQKTGKHYLWTIFTNSVRAAISSPNVAIMPPRVDVRPYIADSDWLVQVSNNMETYCYSINEALSYGVKIARTPLSVAEELNIPKQAEVVLEWDCSNVDDVAKKMFEKRPSFKYTAPEDKWDKLLIDEPSHYTPPKADTKIKCILRYFDLELNHLVKPEDEPFKVTRERAEHLSKLNLVEIVK